MSKKILISPGFGAGWSTWHSGCKEERDFMLTYAPFIEALENKDASKNKVRVVIDKTREDVPEALAPLIPAFVEEFTRRFPDSGVPYMGGLLGLTVVTAYGPFKIHEYDGSESIQYRDEEEWEDA